LGTATAAAGKALFDVSKETADLGVETERSAQKLGLSRQGFQEWDYILQQSGLSTYHIS
jgi:hypothetical protein